ncbi:MAG: porin [Candidatus Pacebacteria bacterium]|nr:porin [Candidatus Paceibacterota bacterium]
MRSKLLTSVAVASFAVVALPQAASAAATMKISGSYESNMSWTQETLQMKPVNSPSSGGLIGRLRLQFDPSMEVDGLTVGARLRTNAGDGTYGYDKAFGYVSGGFGKVTFGRNGALGYAGTFGEVYGNDGQGMVGPDQASVMTKAFTGHVNGRIEGAMGNYVDGAGKGAGNANTINIETPSMGGFQAGVTYAPKWGTDKDWGNSRGDHAAYTNAYEIAAKYSISAGGADVNVAAGYLAASAPIPTGSVGTATNPTGKALVNPIASFGASINVKVADFYAEFGYTNAGDSTLPVSENMKDKVSEDTTAMTVTLGYHVTKDIAVGGYFATGSGTADNLTSTDKLTEIGIGAQYTVIPGFSVYIAGDQVNSTNEPSAASGGKSKTDKASVLSIGSTITF